MVIHEPEFLLLTIYKTLIQKLKDNICESPVGNQIAPCTLEQGARKDHTQIRLNCDDQGMFYILNLYI